MVEDLESIKNVLHSVKNLNHTVNLQRFKKDNIETQNLTVVGIVVLQTLFYKVGENDKACVNRLDNFFYEVKVQNERKVRFSHGISKQVSGFKENIQPISGIRFSIVEKRQKDIYLVDHGIQNEI